MLKTKTKSIISPPFKETHTHFFWGGEPQHLYPCLLFCSQLLKFEALNLKQFKVYDHTGFKKENINEICTVYSKLPAQQEAFSLIQLVQIKTNAIFPYVSKSVVQSQMQEIEHTSQNRKNIFGTDMSMSYFYVGTQQSNM